MSEIEIPKEVANLFSPSDAPAAPVFPSTGNTPVTDGADEESCNPPPALPSLVDESGAVVMVSNNTNLVSASSWDELSIPEGMS